MPNDQQPVQADNTFLIAIAAGITLFAYKYKTEIIANLIVLTEVLVVVSILLLTTYGVYNWRFKKKRLAPRMDLWEIDNSADDDEDFSEPEVQPVPARQENKEQTAMHIDVDALLKRPLHKVEGKLPEECTILKESRYSLQKFVPLGMNSPENYYIQEQKPESFEHTFVVWDTVRLLDGRVENLQVYRTQKPDITFTYKDAQYALEIETPRYLNKKHKRLKLKAETNNKVYGVNWLFISTRSAYKRSLSKYGKVLTRTETPKWIEQTFKK